MISVIKACLVTVLVGGSSSFVSAQMSVNSSKQADYSNHRSKRVKFIDNIAFTPDFKSQPVMSLPSRTLKTNDLITTISVFSTSLIEQCKNLQFKYALLMNVDVESLTVLKVYDFIEDWYGTRYRMGGTTKAGIDCSAFTSNFLLSVYNKLLPRTAREQYGSTQRLERADLKEGDLVFFNTHGGISHVGVYLANGHFVHASSSNGVTISNLDDPYYAKRYIGAGRPIDEVQPDLLPSKDEAVICPLN